VRGCRVRGLLVSALVLAGLPAGPLGGQVTELPGRVTTNIAPPAPVPFGPGETLTYQVKLGVFSVGEGHMTVVGLETVRGNLTYHVTMAIAGGVPLARVEDEFHSWIDIRTLATRRFVQDIREVRYRAFRHYEIFPEERRFQRMDTDDAGDLPTSLPLDDIAFVYFVRTIPLVVGQEYSFHRYFRESGNPVILRVLRKETVTVPAGTFQTVVVRPIIQTRGLFSQGGEAELYFTDDHRRLLVQMRSKVPLVGSISLHLRSITEGRPLRSPPGGEPAPEPEGGPSPPPGP
jgi:hypothetical protein